MKPSPPFAVLQLTHIMDRGGGAEEVVAHIARNLDRSVYRPIVGCLWWGGSYAKELEVEGVPVFIVNQWETGAWRALRTMVDFMKREKVAIAHTHMFMSNTWGRTAALLAGVPIVVATEHLVRDYVKPAKHFVPDLLLSWGTDRIITVSERVRDTYVKGSWIRPSKIETIYNGIDLEKFSPREAEASLRSELLLDGAGPVVGVVARFVEQKGHVYLFESAREVVREFPGVRFLLLGDGPLREMLESKAREYGIRENMLFAGIRHEMPRIYPLMDVSVLSSLAEGFSITVLESAASGVPVVVTDVGGNREIVVDGVTGYLVPPKQPAAFAEKLLSLLRDPERRKAMGTAARERVAASGFTLQRFVENIETLYEGLLREKGLI
jgi:glycosyltransferase involved in cell wall biosynthesis